MLQSVLTSHGLPLMLLNIIIMRYILVTILAGVIALVLNVSPIKAADPVPSSTFGRYSARQIAHYQWVLELSGSPGDIGFGKPIFMALFAIYHVSPSIVRLRITDVDNQRWEVPDIVDASLRHDLNSEIDSELIVEINHECENGFGFKVFRRNQREAIFDSCGLVFADRYLRIQTKLPLNPNLYGLGERISSFRLPLNQTYSMMATDQLTPELKPLYGTHPFYMDLRSDGNAHGVFALNSNPMEVELTDDSLTYRFVGGVFDFFFLAGSRPESVIQQYSRVVGLPYLPPAWHFGFHQCRWGYKNLTTVKHVIDKYKEAQIPLDAIWNDLDYMEGFRIFSLNQDAFPQKQMNDFLDKLHENGQHYIPIIDAGVKIDPKYDVFLDGIESDVFMRATPNDFVDEKYFVGQVWPGMVHFPDWTHPNASVWWMRQVSKFHALAPVDGLWTDMNEVSNFCDGRCLLSASGTIRGAPNDCFSCQFVVTSQLDTPWPGSSRQPLFGARECRSPNISMGLDCGSISMGVKHFNGRYEYDMHNLYGHLEAKATHDALEKVRNARAVVVTRSTFPGSGRFATHWLGDNYSTFKSMRDSISGILTMSLFAIPMVGADICGFSGDASAELCIRWFQLGSFYPFARNHHTLYSSVSQEAYAFGDEAAAIIRSALVQRYKFHHYFYTLSALASMHGGTIVRPVLFEFSSDPNTWELNEQFMVGSCVMVCPQLYEFGKVVDCYLPVTSLWYNITDGALVSSGIFLSPLETIPVFVRGGSIIPLIQSPGLTIKEVRQRDVILVIALDKNHSATGILYIDDGDTLGTVIAGKFTRIEYSVTSIGNVTSNSLEYDLMFVADVVNNGYDASIMISDLRIFPVCNGSLIIEAGFDFPLNIMHSLNVSLSCRRQIKMIEDLPSSIKI